MMTFFDNHALLGITGQHQWYTVKGGSQEYVSRLGVSMAERGVVMRLGTPVEAVRREQDAVKTKARGSDWEGFDEVIFATHSDDSLSMIADPTATESSLLGAVKYQPNRIVLHSDESIMPKRKSVWSSWVYSEDKDKASDRIDLTYWMNKLQPWLKQDHLFVTLNTTRDIDPDLIWDEVTLRHPVYDLAALQAQKTLPSVNGTNRTWFCGAWMKNGFHEDGIGSAMDVVAAIRARSTVQLAAE
jgi:predicted NAD/FAD-binding protein